MSVLFGNRMGGLFEREKPATAEFHQVIRVWKNGDHLAAIGSLDLLRKGIWIQAARRLVDHQENLRHLQFLGDSYRDPRPLVILLIWTKHNDHGI